MTDELFQPIVADTPLPSLAEIMAMWETHAMLANIRAHSRVVRDVALRVADWLVAGGLRLNLPAIEAGALLHDIAKTPCLGSDRRHDIEGALMVARAGYPALSWLVRYHVRLPKDHPIDESAVINYADKRVRHDEVVSLDLRYDYFIEHYGRGVPEYLERIEQGRLKAHRAEARLFSLMKDGHRPEDITRLWREGAL